MSNDTQPEIRFPGFTEDWEERKLGDISDVTKLAGFEFTKYVTYSDEGEVIALRGLNVKNGNLVLDEVKYIDGSDFSKLNRSRLYKNDILFTYVGTVGELAVVPEDDKYYLAPNVARIRMNEGVNPLFVSKLMNDKTFYNKIILPLIATSSQPALSMENVRKFTLMMPEIEEQEKIAVFLGSLDNLIFLHQRKLDLLKETKKGFLQKMFPKNGAKVPEIRFPGFTGDWEDREFSEIVKTTGYKAYLSEAFEVGEYPVIQQGDKPILGYSDKKPFENFEDVVLFGDHTLSLYKPETPFLVATDGLKIITVPNFSGSFLLSLLEKYVPESQGYKRHFTILKKEQVAFPTDVKERVLIGEFFTQIDRTITLHERELDLLKETKKGFLQKMFV
ncbi:restriction endonuclease subunit S [Enterococcus hirae]|nr:restriction endonuclease subunit S [Enterococcus hirae]